MVIGLNELAKAVCHQGKRPCKCYGNTCVKEKMDEGAKKVGPSRENEHQNPNCSHWLLA